MPTLLDDLSEGFAESVELLIKLADCRINDDQGAITPEMSEVEGRAEKLWYELNDTDTIILDAMSADLWYLVDGGPLKGREPTDELRVRYEKAKSDDNLLEIAWSLHDCPKLASGVEGARIRLYLWKSLGQSEMTRRFETLWTREKFKELRDQWHNDTNLLSFIKSDHPAYQGIIKLGMPVVPILLEEMRDDPDWWSVALEVITGENPCKFPEMSGNLAKISKAWVDWGTARGLLK
jgi:hypothetical protein